MILPASWAVVLEVFRPVFRRRGTFRLFTVLATGMAAQRGRRTVVGMLAGAGMASRISFHAACRFFSAAVRDVDQLGLAAAGFVVTRLLDPGAPAVVALDDTLFKRWGRLVHHAFWTPMVPPGASRRSAGGTGGSSPGSWSGCRSAPPRCACRCCCGCGPARAATRR
jgi:hypothetical protein